ncbi:MAG TPA: hypothetical protein VIE88_12405 [Vicinamibacteria bacterium]
MLTFLVVGEPPEGEALPEPDSSLEVLHARDAEEAVEKLGRNRRIDAVLVLGAPDLPSAVEAIREDVIAPPPIFLPPGAPAIPGTRRAAGPSVRALLAAMGNALSEGSSADA